MQKPKSGPVAKKYLFLFLGRPRARTNVNDLFIQPYTFNRKGMHWNRLNRLLCLPPFCWNLDRWRPHSGEFRSETLLFDQLQDFYFFVYGVCMAYLWICWFMCGLLILCSFLYILWRWGSANDQFSIKEHFQKLGCEFHIYQKAWNDNLVNPKNFSICKEGNHPILNSRY